MRTPKYRRHSSGQAFVEIGRRRIYLGKHGSQTSQQKYASLLLERQLGDAAILTGQSADTGSNGPLLIKQMVAAFWQRKVIVDYVKNGRPTSEQASFRSALRFLWRAFGDIPAAEFRPFMLEQVRDAMTVERHVRAPKYARHKPRGRPARACVRLDGQTLDLGEYDSPESRQAYDRLIHEWLRKKRAQGQCRSTINKHVHRIRQAFCWAASKDLVPAAVWESLRTVAGLRRGRSKAKESIPVGAVSDDDVEATRAHLSSVVAAMVQFQRLTGCRPGEVCILRPRDIECIESERILRLDGAARPAAGSANVWCYRPATHKTEHRDKERRIYIGPRAQAVLRPFLERDPEEYCFDPREAVGWEAAAALETDQPRDKQLFLRFGDQAVVRRSARPRRRPPGRHYTPASYRRAIRRAIELAARRGVKIVDWAPNQLRHSSATEIERRFGIEASRVVLGHTDAATTKKHYVERDFARAAAIMAEVG